MFNRGQASIPPGSNRSVTKKDAYCTQYDYRNLIERLLGSTEMLSIPICTWPLSGGTSR